MTKKIEYKVTDEAVMIEGLQVLLDKWTDRGWNVLQVIPMMRMVKPPGNLTIPRQQPMAAQFHVPVLWREVDDSKVVP